LYSAFLLSYHSPVEVSGKFTGIVRSFFDVVGAFVSQKCVQIRDTDVALVAREAWLAWKKRKTKNVP
jgi:hypothetical protein